MSDAALDAGGRCGRAGRPSLAALLMLVHVWCGIVGLIVTITALGMWNLGEFQKKKWLGPGADLMPLGEYLATVFAMAAMIAVPTAVVYVLVKWKNWRV